MTKRYQRPAFLEGLLSEESYLRWLRRKAIAHVRRDRARGNATAAVSAYTQEIHRAVAASRGLDFYTGKRLDWSLISTYDNKASQEGGRTYKKGLADLPTVDHLGDGLGDPRFVITSWRVNDAKHDLTLEEFQALCAAVLRHHGYLVTKPHPDSSGPIGKPMNAPYRSGSTTTTRIGYTNRNNQRCEGTRGMRGTDHGQSVYLLRCLNCHHEYGANGSDVHLRKCPACQGGAAGIPGEP